MSFMSYSKRKSPVDYEQNLSRVVAFLLEGKTNVTFSEQ
jgi:hypothetical protein